MKNLILTIFISLFQFTLFSQGVAINNDASNPDASAILDIKSSTKGILVSRMTQTQRNSIPSPATGLLIYQTDITPGFYYYNGSSWVACNSPSGGAGGDLTGTYPNPTIADNSVDGTDIALGSDATGDIIYYNGTDWVRLAAGTTGQVLQTNGASAPTWVTKTDKFSIPFSNGSGTSVAANLWFTVYETRTLVSTAQGTSPDRSGAAVPTQSAFTYTATQACTMTGFRMWISNGTSNKVYAVAVYKYPITENATVLGTGAALISSTNVTVSPTVGLGMTSVNITPTSTVINPGEVIMIMIKSSSTASQTVYLNGAMEFTNQ